MDIFVVVLGANDIKITLKIMVIFSQGETQLLGSINGHVETRT
jgi:hypothetical protein